MTDLRPPELPKEVAPYGRAYPVSELGYAPDESADLVALVKLLVGEWRLIACFVTVSVALAAMVAYTMAPTYRAEVLLAPVAPPKSEAFAAIGPLGDLASLFETVVGGPRDRTSESIAALRSRSLALDFIKEQELKPLLFPDRWDSAQKSWRSDVRPPSDLDAYELFDRHIRTVKLDRRTGLVTLSIDWHDPVAAARWANRLVEHVNARRRSDAVQEAQKSIVYIQRQLGRTSSLEVRQALYRLIEVQTKTSAVAQAREEYAFRVIDEAIPPERRIRPRRLLMLQVAALAGLTMAVLGVLLKQAVRRFTRARPG